MNSSSSVDRVSAPSSVGAKRVEIFVIGGWLGSGKTTFLNRLLSRRAEAFQASGVPDRVAVLVNDVGDVHLDPLWVKRRDAKSIELLDGCICCSIGDSLAVVLRDLVLGPQPPRTIFIEASGLAQPGKVAKYGDRRRVVVRDVIVTVDVMDIEKRLEDATYGKLAGQQLVEARRLVLTKADLVSEDALRRTHRFLATRFEAPIHSMDVALDSVSRPARVLELPEDESMASKSPGAPKITEVHGAGNFTWRAKGRLNTQALAKVVESLAALGVLRAKGVVIDSSGDRWILQLAGTLVSRERFTAGAPRKFADVADRALEDGSSLVVIFDPAQLDRRTIEERFETCLAPPKE